MEDYKLKHLIPFLLFFAILYIVYLYNKNNSNQVFFKEGSVTKAYIFSSDLDPVQSNTIYNYRFSFKLNEYTGSTIVNPLNPKLKLQLHDSIFVYFLPTNPFKNISGFDLYNTNVFKKNIYKCEYFLCD